MTSIEVHLSTRSESHVGIGKHAATAMLMALSSVQYQHGHEPRQTTRMRPSGKGQAYLADALLPTFTGARLNVI